MRSSPTSRRCAACSRPPGVVPCPTMEPEDPSRRQVIVTALGGGFALAVRPVAAATITTGADGLDIAEVKVPTASGALPAYRAMPGGKKPAKGKGFPVILVVHEIFGVHEHI